MKTLIAIALFLQTTGGPAFEAASIKPTQTNPGNSSSKSDKGRLSMRNVTLRRCIRGAWGVTEEQVLGGPKWLDENRYDIEAKAEGPAGDSELMAMLRSLLVERLQLKFHSDTRELPGFALLTAKSGIKAKHSQAGGNYRTNTGRGLLEVESCTMPQLAFRLSIALHKPVADFTGIAGAFDFKLEWTEDEMRAKASDAPDAPSLFSAVPEQLGLKLESRRIPVEVLVIDRAELPSEN